MPTRNGANESRPIDSDAGRKLRSKSCGSLGHDMVEFYSNDARTRVGYRCHRCDHRTEVNEVGTRVPEAPPRPGEPSGVIANRYGSLAAG